MYAFDNRSPRFKVIILNSKSLCNTIYFLSYTNSNYTKITDELLLADLTDTYNIASDHKSQSIIVFNLEYLICKLNYNILYFLMKFLIKHDIFVINLTSFESGIIFGKTQRRQ